LAVINRHREAALTAEIDLGGWQPVSPAMACTVNADDVDATNDFGHEHVGWWRDGWTWLGISPASSPPTR
jgi:alpha-L-arabinofuranosidase